MPSLIPGFEYDIFISYRQKDNKYDGWVSEFVDNLMRELGSTFKEEISVYFDENPHDGLLETHDVGKSLETKLKCLIFIPIISQTYCDSNSFAWKQEFCVFNQLAKADPFGRDIRLVSGNVTSRILPVKIHDLDPEDKALLENELGGVLRCIDFIYKSAGVNRPLRAQEDHPQDNLNKTYYRDQINKVANAVKEIITGIKRFDQQGGEVSKERMKVRSEMPKNRKAGIAIGSFLLVVLLVLGYFFIQKLSKSSDPIEKSIAVLPFINLSNDPEQEYFSDGMVDEILDRLVKVGDLKVISRTSSMQYKKTKLSLIEIARELGVAAILEGSVMKINNKVRITAQLIDAKTGFHLWSDKYDRDLSDIFSIQSEIAKEIASELKTELSPEEIKKIEKRSTENLEAYNFYLLGKYFMNQNVAESLKEGVRCFKNSVQLDSTYALAYVGLAQCYQFMVRYSHMPRDEGNKKAKEAILKAIELDESLGEAHATLGLLMIVFDLDIYGPEQEFQKAIVLSPNSSEVYTSYAQYLRWIGKYDQGAIVAKRAAELDPLSSLPNIWLGAIYFYAGRYDESIEYLNRMLSLDSNFVYTYAHLSFNYTLKRMYAKAIYYADKTMSIGDTKEPSLVGPLAWVYAKSGEINKAKEILTQLLELQRYKNVDPIFIAEIYVGLGEHEKAFYWLLKAYEVRSGALIYLNAFRNTFFKDIGSDPRYIDLLKKIGFK